MINIILFNCSRGNFIMDKHEIDPLDPYLVKELKSILESADRYLVK